MRVIRPANRDAVFERLEGWWNDEVIRLLTGATIEGILGDEISAKMFSLSEEYKADNLPITFLGKEPAEGIDTENDPRPFVWQLREIGISKDRIHSAIMDFYRAFEQRSEWTRENLLVPGELDRYEDRLVDEWKRFKDVVFEELEENSAEDALKRAGKDLYKWADLESGKIHSLRIRERVTERPGTKGRERPGTPGKGRGGKAGDTHQKKGREERPGTPTIQNIPTHRQRPGTPTIQNIPTERPGTPTIQNIPTHRERPGTPTIQNIPTHRHVLP
jgi:hypothetical protein